MWRLRVYPGASSNSIAGFTDGVLHIRIAAPPVKGKANEELRKFLSKALGVSKISLEIVKGAASRNKVLSISGLSQEDIFRRLSLKPSFFDDASK